MGIEGVYLVGGEGGLVRYSWIVCPRLSVALPFASFPKTPHELETRRTGLECCLLVGRCEGGRHIVFGRATGIFPGWVDDRSRCLGPDSPAAEVGILEIRTHLVGFFCLILMYSSTSGTTTNTRSDPSIRRFTRRRFERLYHPRNPASPPLLLGPQLTAVGDR